MKITIDKDVIDWMIKNDLWALVEYKIHFYLGNALFSFLRQIQMSNLIEAPKELNIRKLIYYVIYKKDVQTWYILLRYMGDSCYEVIRIISAQESDGKYFY